MSVYNLNKIYFIIPNSEEKFNSFLKYVSKTWITHTAVFYFWWATKLSLRVNTDIQGSHLNIFILFLKKSERRKKNC